MGSNKRITLILSIIVIILSMIACIGGIFWKSLYNDNPFVTSIWIGNDLITLILVIPLNFIALIISNRSSLKAKLIWAGTLWYMVYNYNFYMYGAAFNEFFLLYVIIFILSLIAFIVLFAELSSSPHIRKIAKNPSLPVKRISIYMFFFAGFIGSMWILISIMYIFSKEVPLGITQTGHPTAVTFASDLSFLVAPLFIGAILLLRRHVLGYVISVIIMVKSILYPLVLLVGGILAYRNTGQWDPLTPAYLLLGLACFMCLISLLKGFSSGNNIETS